MPTYLWQVHYAQSGAQGVLDEGGTPRVAAIRTMVESVGGVVHQCWFGLADHHLYVIGEVPDEVAAATLRLRTVAAGAARSEAIPLLSAEQVDEAVQRGITYRTPGTGT